MMLGLCVLVVDDEEGIRRNLGLLLEPLYKVVGAASGAEALRLLKEHSPRVMLLDISMPGMDGLEVLHRALLAKPNLKVIMLTGNEDVDLARQALELGAKAYVTKPFDGARLKADVRRLFAGASKDSSIPWNTSA